MKRTAPGWMEFKGVRNAALNVELLSMPARTTPVMNARVYAVAGRSGTALVTDGSYADVRVACALDLTDGARVREVNAWLSGEGLLRFSDEPDLAYEARVLKSPEHVALAPRLDVRAYTVVFACKPFRVAVPEPKPLIATASGQTFFNPGTAPAPSRVTVTGSGDFAITIGKETISFFDIEDGISVDAATLDATTPDGSALINDRLSGRPWTIPPGRFKVEWSLGEGGRIDRIEILPRWRWM